MVEIFRRASVVTGDRGIQVSPDAFCPPELVGEEIVMVAQQPIAVLPVRKAGRETAEQHGAKRRTELAEIV
ncbi:MAG: hypothetical protein OXG96_00135 [Acidobacteria bacterium]|nr:hypothetical protein [Acidobacteriota bacterium]